MIIIEIIYNLSLIVTASIVSGFVDKRFNRKKDIGKVLQGFVFGIIAVLAMLNPYVLSPGIIFDGRSIIISLAALYFGRLTGVIATLIALTARIIIGGGGAIVGCAVILSSFLIGILFNYLKKKEYIEINTLWLYLFGILVHIVMLFFMFFLPNNFVWITFRTIAITVISVYPLITVLIGKILKDQEDNLILLEEIKQSEEKHKSMIENSFDIIYIISSQGNFTYVSPSWEVLLGHKKEEVIGKHFSEFIHIDDTIKFGEFLNNVIKTKKRKEGIEYRIQHLNGSWLWHTTSAVPLINKDGIVTGFEGVSRDITAKLKIEKNLKEALEKAEEMNRLKSNFLANMNHEIRTPLNGMLGFAEILSMELTNPVQRNMAATILYSGKRLSETLNLILDLASIESQNINFNKTQTDIVALLKKIIEPFKEVINNKGLELKCSLTNNKIFSLVDEHFFARAIHNIIDNAVKYTNVGYILIEVNANNDKIVIKIKDTGIGIPEDKISVIWDAFRQVSEGLNRGFEGTGLGLTISRKIIQLLHGTIDVKSEVGVGSEFIVTIPLLSEEVEEKVENIPIIEIAEEEDGKKELKKLLYVEDDPINRSVVKIFLKKMFKIYTAEDAKSALELITKEKFDIILMDINLGVGLNGIDVTKEIRKQEHYKDIPIIAVTAYTADTEKEEFIKAGCTDYISKPFDRKTLLENLKKLMN
jgi:hypothetical protein